MLQIILGRSGFSKTKFLRDLLFNNKNLKNKFILLVPEQYSFENERALLNLIGEKFNNNIEVLSFKKLIKFVYKKINKAPIKSITKSEKNILMSIAIETVKDKLKLFKNCSDNSELIKLMVSCLNEFKMCNVNDNKLKEFEENNNNIILQQKVHEARLILNSYETLIKKTYNDPLDELTKTYKLLLEDNIFYDYNIIIDGFDGFTVQQLLIIERLMVQSTKCYITFCTDGLDNNNTDIFFPVNKYLSRILNIAKNNNIEVANEIILNSPKRFINNDLKILEKNIFRNKKSFSEECPKNILLYCAQNKYDESNFICNKIMDLIINKNYRFKDIAIITRNTDTYKGILDIYLKKYDIPYFMDKNESINSKPLMKFVINTFNVILSNFSSESIINYLKTGLLNFSTDEISIVENYVLTWEISNNEWKSNFLKNPNGFNSKNNNLSQELLIKLNDLRKKIIEPLSTFENNLKGADATGITKAIYMHLDDIKACENLKNISKNLIDSNNIRLAEEQVKLWDLLMDILSQMAKILNKKDISIKKYLDLLILVMNSNEISFIPKSLDEITVGSADRFKNDNIKIVFLIGATQGEFPRTPASAGIFKDDERKKLLSFGFNLHDPLENIAINEKFIAYRTTSIASEKLFVSWPSNSISGEQKRESEIVKEIKSIFKNIKVHHKYSDDIRNEVFSVKPAFELCSKHFNDNSRFSETLKKYFLDSEDYKDKIEALQKISYNKFNNFKEFKNINILLENKLTLSPSSIEQYYLCPFSFFCKYVLLAKKNKQASFDSLEYGTLMHYLLENIFSSNSAQNLINMRYDDLYKLIDKHLNIYINEKFGGINNLSKRLQYLIKRTINTIKPLILHIANELSQSKFSPQEFELSISKKGKIKPLTIDLSNGKKLEISGKIDRLDIMKKNGISYIRIIDYKTGIKEFKLSDINYGLNIQMLLYLYIILKNGTNIYGHMIPSGILYMPAKKPIITANKNIPQNKIDEQKLKRLKMNGLILNSTDVILGMEPNGNGEFIPAVIKDDEPQKSDSLVTMNEMNNILKKVYELVIKMGNEIFNSNISPFPLKGKNDACEYCEFSSICGFEENNPVKNKL